MVFGLQEIIDLNAKTVILSGNEREVKVWEHLIEKNLKQFGNYVKVEALNLIGIYVGVWVKQYLADRMHILESDFVKCGLGGTLGNKGGVVVKFLMDDT